MRPRIRTIRNAVAVDVEIAAEIRSGLELFRGLDDRVTVLPGVRIDAMSGAMAGEGFRKRGGGRDRVPGTHGRAAIDRAERRRRIALDVNLVADRVRAADAQPDRAIEMLARVVAAHMQGLEIRRDQLVL